MNTNIDIGARIRRLRLERNMTQEQLARRLNLSAQAVSKWENGLTMPDIQLLPQLSVLLGCTIDALFDMTDDARFERIDSMLEDVRFLSEAEFSQTERWLKLKREEDAARPRATLLLAQLYNKRAAEYHRMASPIAREALTLNPEEKNAHNVVFEAERGPFADWYGQNHHRLIDFYKSVVAARPDDRHNYYWLLDLLREDRRTAEARDTVERLRRVADTWHCEMYLGEICLAECDLPGALEQFEKMLAREPENWLVWFAYGNEMARLCRYEDALRANRRAMELREKPRYVDCEETAAQIYEIIGDRPAAAQMHRRIIDIMREDWGYTEGEGVDVHRREIERLEGSGGE